MTKEELIYRIKTEEATLTISQIDEFFSQNVCIPKGANRHPYADVLHMAIEGVEIETTQKYNDLWRPAGLIVSDNLKYRIKPSEPVYEYLWKYPSTEFDATTDNYLTEEEVDKLGFALWCKTETKRVRQ